MGGLLAAVLILNIINPYGLIASYNLDHDPRLATGVDRTYLYSSLSSDAVPVIVANISVFGEPCDQLVAPEGFPLLRRVICGAGILARSIAAGQVAAFADKSWPRSVSRVEEPLLTAARAWIRVVGKYGIATSSGVTSNSISCTACDDSLSAGHNQTVDDLHVGISGRVEIRCPAPARRRSHR